jgi:hypothetical protein
MLFGSIKSSNRAEQMQIPATLKCARDTPEGRGVRKSSAENSNPISKAAYSRFTLGSASDSALIAPKGMAFDLLDLFLAFAEVFVGANQKDNC